MEHNGKEIWMDDEIEKISEITQVERKDFVLSWLSVSKMRFETIECCSEKGEFAGRI